MANVVDEKKWIRKKKKVFLFEIGDKLGETDRRA
jgi:hypothetical protein